MVAGAVVAAVAAVTQRLSHARRLLRNSARELKRSAAPSFLFFVNANFCAIFATATAAVALRQDRRTKLAVAAVAAESFVDAQQARQTDGRTDGRMQRFDKLSD